MVSSFYQKHSRKLLCLIVLSFPLLVYEGQTLPENNDFETWLPRDSDVRVTYERFKDLFGAEEIVLVAIARSEIDPKLIEPLCRRIESLPGVSKCWSPSRLQALAGKVGVPEGQFEQRLRGLALSEDGSLIGLTAEFSEHGLQNRDRTVAEIRKQLRYCQLDGRGTAMAGSPVLLAEMNRLGHPRENKKFFVLTLLISLVLLYATTRQWKLSLAVLGLTVWAINLTMTGVKLAGGEMNFVLGALSVMVLVFTLAIIVHLLHYYRVSINAEQPLEEALRLAWKPCLLATVTTAVGLLSLTVSEFYPVRQFGCAAAAGTFVALLTGLGLAPALLVLWPDQSVRSAGEIPWFRRTARGVIRHGRAVAIGAGVIVLAAGTGVARLESKIDPMDFLPDDNPVLLDHLRIERELTNVDSVEAVVDFRGRGLSFRERVNEVRRLQEVIGEHPAVRASVSAATFLPENLPSSPLVTAGIRSRLRSWRREGARFVAGGGQVWRISARVKANAVFPRDRLLTDLRRATRGAPVTFTGIAPLLDHAQSAIFEGFWRSFATALLVITALMILSLRSIRFGLVAMIPNLTPVCIVFGILGWTGLPVDIGTMMTASIALGIAVDGTFHFLVRYRERMREGDIPVVSARSALMQTGVPIFKAAAIAGIGMLALSLSNFAPTARFGLMLAALLLAALIGDLLLLPALLSLRRGSDGATGEQGEPVGQPKFLAAQGSQRQRPAKA